MTAAAERAAEAIYSGFFGHLSSPRQIAEMKAKLAALIDREVGAADLALFTTPAPPLLKKIVEICDSGSAQEFGDADERLKAIRGLIIDEAV